MVDGDDPGGTGDLEAAPNLGWGEAVGDGNDRTTGADDTEVGGDALEVHRHVEGDGVAGREAVLPEAVCDAVDQCFELTVGMGDDPIAALAPFRHRDGAVRGLEAAVGDIELGSGKPDRLRRAFGKIEGLRSQAERSEIPSRSITWLPELSTVIRPTSGEGRYRCPTSRVAQAARLEFETRSASGSQTGGGGRAGSRSPKISLNRPTARQMVSPGRRRTSSTKASHVVVCGSMVWLLSTMFSYG